MFLFCMQNALTAHERARVEQMIQEEERLLMEQSELRVDVIDLTRLAQIKVSLQCNKLKFCSLMRYGLF